MIIVYENWVGGKPQQEIKNKKGECMCEFQNHVLIVLGCKANMTEIWGIAGSLQTTTDNCLATVYKSIEKVIEWCRCMI